MAVGGIVNFQGIEPAILIMEILPQLIENRLNRDS